jgi:hypothetical protein
MEATSALPSAVSFSMRPSITARFSVRSSAMAALPASRWRPTSARISGSAQISRTRPIIAGSMSAAGT